MPQSIILAVNTGSSSVRLSAFDANETPLSLLATERFDKEAVTKGAPQELLRTFLQTHDLKRVDVVSHRVVHGGARFTSATLLNQEAERAIGELSHLAPLHNPRALVWIEACRAVLGEKTLQIAVFDTAFYAQLPAVAATYALPRELCRKHGIRRFGFHGLAHGSMWNGWRKSHPQKSGGRVISLQLGSGCSISAVRDGVPQDTSMGFSPLEGLVMSTRCGDVDAGLLTFLQREEKMTPDEVESLLNTKSGLLGVSGISGDMRELLKSDAPEAKLAIELFCYRARKYIGAYLAVLGGADAIVFGGGVGENAAILRERILSDLEWCGIILDRDANNSATAAREVCISTPTSRIEVWILPVDEAQVLAREAIAFLPTSSTR